MKQYITEDQFNKLSNKAQEVLKSWTIEKKKDIHIERFDGGKKYSYWNVSTCYDGKWKFGREHKELVNVLWEAIKRELGDYVD